jgi:hypothetical protein
MAEIFAFLPEPRRVEIVQQPLIEMPRAPLAHSPDEIRAVDSVFVQDEDKADAAMGLIGLSISAPWLVDLLAEQLFPSRDEHEEPPQPRPEPDEEK